MHIKLIPLLEREKVSDENFTSFITNLIVVKNLHQKDTILFKVKYQTHLFLLSSIGPDIMVYIEYYTAEKNARQLNLKSSFSIYLH